MKNIHVLPTEKPSRLYKSKITQNIFICNIISQYGDATYNQNIYITSDEEIKEGDWGLSKLNEVILFGRSYNEKFYKKIILTTDQDLITDGVQSIDDNFLEWFVKNPSCESVKVERLDTFKKTEEVYVDEIAGGNYYEIIKQYKIIIPQEETKQETLEEAAERIYQKGLQDDIDLSFYDGVRLGAEWQSERMYSEVFEWLSSKDYLSDKMEFIQKEFEQFKNK
jgi:hypothetical protein